jgi:hypothetical protein
MSFFILVVPVVNNPKLLVMKMENMGVICYFGNNKGFARIFTNKAVGFF